jgi:DeoR/GlpR family transcriptional regulator of sugar metabolism
MVERAKRPTKDERRQLILAELNVKPIVRVLELARRLGVHVETIRRDLDELHSSGKISRTYGSALSASTSVEPSLAERDRLLVAERRRIGQAAAAMVDPGDVLMVDVGSTTAHFARCLADRGCEARIITNSWKLVAALNAAPKIEVTLCPGAYSHRQGGVAGQDTTDFLRRFHADKAVLSIGGLAETGLYEFEPSFAWVKRAMLENAETRILILDHSKFGRKAMTWVCGLEAVSHLVVDELPQGPILEQADRAGIRIHVAPGN